MSMASFTIKRIFIAIYGISFVIAAVCVVITVNYQQRQQALLEAQEKARLILDRNLAIHSYFSKQLKPQIFALGDRFFPDGYFNPAWMSSTYAVREIDKYYKELSKNDYYYKECAVNARSPENEADPLERSFIDELKKDTNLSVRSLTRNIDGKPYFVVMRRGESMEKNCLRCHSTPAAAPQDLVREYGSQRSFNRIDGELVSAISIRIPLKDAYAQANSFSFKLSIILLVILAVSSFIQFLIMRHVLLNPLRFLRDQTDALVHDESRLGQDLPVLSRAKELDELTNSFNNLSRHLRREKDSLVEQVQERTCELQAANRTLEEDIIERREIQAKLAEKVQQLETALAKVKMLEGILPICSYCKKIRKDAESWQQLEHYITDHSEALFSHGICPECYTKAMNDIGKAHDDKCKQ